MRLGCLVLLLAVIPACAQETPLSKSISDKQASIALLLLRSPDTCTRAWGAYLAGKYDLKENAKDLVAELERLQPAGETAEFAEYRTTWYVQTLLDALIQLRHPVEPAVLMPFRPRWGPEVLILLLARDAEANQDSWFSLLAEDLPCEQWLAVSNFLAGMGAPGFAAKLLSAVQFHMTVVVAEKGSVSGGSVGGSGSYGLPGAPPGCPPAAIYRLSLTAWPEYVMLAPGPTPVYYRRSVTDGSRITGSGYSFSSALCDKQKGMQNHLAKFADLKQDQIRDVFEPTTYVIWDGIDSYKSQVQAAIAAQAQRITWMLGGLVSKGVLSEEERSALRLVIQVQQQDQRKAGGDPLPPVHDVPVTLP